MSKNFLKNRIRNFAKTMAKFWKMRCYVLFNKVIAFFYYLGEDWGSGGMEEWKNGRMEKNGMLEEWKNGGMEEWRNGSMEVWKKWNVGRMEE